MISAPADAVGGIAFYAAVCIIGFVAVLCMLRSDRNSIGMPAAYLFLLLQAHLPGALIHIIGTGVDEGAAPLSPSIYTAIGLEFTAVGVVCFAIGVWLARRVIPGAVMPRVAFRPRFWRFCLVGGWIFYFVLVAPLHNVPSLGAAIHEGAGLWMLGVMLALAHAFERGNQKAIVLWGCALVGFSVMGFVIGGFLSYGARATTIVLGMLAVTVRKGAVLVVVIPLVSFLGLSLFAQYMYHRYDIRTVLWNDEAGIVERIQAVAPVLEDFRLLDTTDPDVLIALDQRLNQNRFIGLAAERIRSHESAYLYGTTVRDAFLALIPRAIWPEKPMTAGSSDIVAKATGLYLDTETSWGVGNVMEFQINFGWLGVIVGFLLLGFGIGSLDRKTAIALARGDLRNAIVLFLPCVACLQPAGSLVEVLSGAGAALVAALWWRWVWMQWNAQPQATHVRQHALVGGR